MVLQLKGPQIGPALMERVSSLQRELIARVLTITSASTLAEIIRFTDSKASPLQKAIQFYCTALCTPLCAIIAAYAGCIYEVDPAFVRAVGDDYTWQAARYPRVAVRPSRDGGDTNELWVAAHGVSEVLVFDRHQFGLLRRFASPRPFEVVFLFAESGAGTVLVLNGDNGTVSEYDPDTGALRRSFAGPGTILGGGPTSWGCNGAYGFCVLRGHVYITQANPPQRVVVYNLADWSFVRQFGAPGIFNAPNSIIALPATESKGAPSGRGDLLLVADTVTIDGRCGVHVVDAKTGTCIGKFLGDDGTGSQLANIYHMRLVNDYVFLADSIANRVGVFELFADRSGWRFVHAFGGPGQFHTPTAVAASQDGCLFVGESSKLQIFRYT